MTTDVYLKRSGTHTRCVLSTPHASLPGTILSGSVHSPVTLSRCGLRGEARRRCQGCGGSNFPGINYLTPEGTREREEDCGETVYSRRRDAWGRERTHHKCVPRRLEMTLRPANRAGIIVREVTAFALLPVAVKWYPDKSNLKKGVVEFQCSPSVWKVKRLANVHSELMHAC